MENGDGVVVMANTEIAGSEVKFTKDKNNKANGFEINDNGYKMQAVKIE